MSNCEDVYTSADWIKAFSYSCEGGSFIGKNGNPRQVFVVCRMEFIIGDVAAWRSFSFTALLSCSFLHI